MKLLLQHSKSPALCPKSILGTLKEAFQIDYIDYSILKENKITAFTSDNGRDLNRFINDKCGSLNRKLNGHGHLKWRDYCSTEFLDDLFNDYQLNPTGICSVIKHHDSTEYISLGSQNNNTDLYELCTHQPHQHSRMINRIRSIAHQLSHCCATISLQESQSSYEIQKETPSSIACKNFIYGLKGKAYLTPQEFHCIIGVGEMRTLNQIASEMKISIKTVATYVNRAKHKLGTIKRNQLHQVLSNNLLI